MNFKSKLPEVENSIFAVMSQKAAEYDAVNLSQGFPNFDADPKLLELVCHYLKKGYNQYAPMPGVPELRKAIVDKHSLCQSVYYDCNTEITVTAGATQAIATAIATVVCSGDEVIVFEPTYDAYEPLVELQGGKTVPIELKFPDFKPDWNEVKNAINLKTKAIIINSPHNPCGSTLTKDDLVCLADILKGTNILIISDEVYEHIVFDGQSHLSLGSNPELYKRTFVISSFGKTLHTTGWKVGYCLAPESLTSEFRKAHQFIVYAVNTPVQYAIAEYLKDPDSYNSVSPFYEKKRDLAEKLLLQTSFKPSKTSGTYFQLLDYSHTTFSNGFEITEKLVKENGIALIPLEPFYKKFIAPKLIRVCFAKKDETLEVGLKKLIGI